MNDAVFRARLHKTLEILNGTREVAYEDESNRARINVLRQKDFNDFLKRWTDVSLEHYFDGRAVRIVYTEQAIVIDRGRCVNCKHAWADHFDKKCPFASTEYDDDDGTLPEIRMIQQHLAQIAAKPRPTFSACVRAIRGAAGDKRKFHECPESDGLSFRFPYDARRLYDKAFDALSRLNPVFGEQYTHSENRLEITISRRACAHCKMLYSEHQPAGGQCLFHSTSYTERIDHP